MFKLNICNGHLWAVLLGASAASALLIRSATDSDTPRAPAKVFTATELSQAYQLDPFAANARFEGQRILISGVIHQVFFDTSGAPGVYLQGEDRATTRPKLVFNLAHGAVTSSLRHGVELTLVCTGNAYAGTALLFDDCESGN